jgi:hypothetical protein
MYAWALIEDLIAEYPDRRRLLVLHTATFSKRSNEISDFLRDEKIKIVDDYKEGEKNRVYKQVNVYGTDKENYLSKVFRIVIKALKHSLANWLNSLGVLLTLDSNKSLNQIKPWTIWIRGTYYKRGLSSQTVYKMKARARNSGLDFPVDTSEKNHILLHYRLGDLLTIVSKSPIKSSELLPATILLSERVGCNTVKVFSDSPSIAYELLKSDDLEFMSDNRTLNGRETLNELVGAKYLVGTNSKLSEWAVILRLSNSLDNYCLIPEYMWSHLREICPFLSGARNVTTY